MMRDCVMTGSNPYNGATTNGGTGLWVGDHDRSHFDNVKVNTCALGVKTTTGAVAQTVQ